MTDMTKQLFSATAEQHVQFKRRIGLWGTVSMGLGIIIGSGIFISPKGVTAGAGSMALSLALWMVGGLGTLCGLMSFIELGLMMPQSGGQYVYILRHVGRPVAFMFAWMSGMMIGPAGIAIISLTCSKYILINFYDDSCPDPPQMHVMLLAVVIIVYIGVQNMISVTLSTRIQIIFTVAKVLALLFVIVGGVYSLSIGRTENVSKAFEGSNYDIGALSSGLLSALFAYSGWETMVAFSEEVINPEKTLPRAAYITVISVTIIYLLANVSYMTLLNIPELLAAPAVVIAWVQRLVPSLVWLMALSVAMSTFGGVNGSFFVAGRMFLAYAREGHTLSSMAMINIKKHTPTPAILFEMLLSIALVQWGEVQRLIGFSGVLNWTTIAVTIALVPYLRWRRPDIPRPYKCSLIFPFVGTLFATMTVVLPIVTDPRPEYILAILLCLSGFIFYIPFVCLKWKIPGMEKLTVLIQLLMQVTFTDYKLESIDTRQEKTN